MKDIEIDIQKLYIFIFVIVKIKYFSCIHEVELLADKTLYLMRSYKEFSILVIEINSKDCW